MQLPVKQKNKKEIKVKEIRKNWDKQKIEKVKQIKRDAVERFDSI